MSQTEAQAQPQQSWAAWILDAYANSVITSHEDFSDDSSYESPTAESVDMSNKASDTSSSPYGPYVRTGRGGAGNFTWQSEQARDPETQAPISLKERRNITLDLEHIDTSLAVKKSQARRTVTYPRVGRGGAGNIYYQSNEIQQSPTTASFAKSPVSVTSSPVMYTGRGGAGNYVVAKNASDLARQAKEKQEQVDAAKRREDAEQQVQSLLKAPTQAYTGSRRRSFLPEDFETWT